MSILTKDIILTKLKGMQPIFKKEGVNLLGLFGSYSRDEAREDSDIDILIETTPEFSKMNRGFSAYSKLNELKTLLQDTFEREVDIVDKQGLLDHNNTYILNRAIYV
ncbi:MAG: nucleotidyltransferase domain-containing protein [Campylobacterota bacterium]|nr:nucleotidyltransferase domain-containing protein [Campylobacterota bacterium]